MRIWFVLMLSCGGATVAPPAEHASAPASPAAQCIATADAKRERRPDEPQKVTVKHVLVKWAGAKRAPKEITRTREEACLRALEARSKLEKGASFADVVAEYSEEPGAATREGMLGTIERTQAEPAFADAAFELHVGEVSYVVESGFGFHVIMRTE
ncbi:MAG TPA: peptidylprolyl isomerase [Polyangiaceae bacterium]|nr:peptidylprolyl isomerase [Polyangiaceae bacterium]